MMTVIDEVAPLSTKSYIDKPRAPWFEASHLEKRRCLRSLERKFIKTGLTIHKDIFKATRNAYRSDLDNAYASYHRERIAGADQKTMFHIVDLIIGSP